MSIGSVEALWIVINLVTLIVTFLALTDARADQKAVKLLNGRARELVQMGIVRREFFRLLVQFVFLAIAIPSLFVDNEVSLFNPVVLGLMSVAVILCISTVLDWRDRRQMMVLVTAELLEVRSSQLDVIEHKLDEASAHAEKAYHEANSVNLKIANQGAAILVQGEAQAAAALTGEDTHRQVTDIHEQTVPKAEGVTSTEPAVDSID